MGTQSKAIGSVVGVGVGEAVSRVIMYFLDLIPVVHAMPSNVTASLELVLLAAITFGVTYAFPANKQKALAPPAFPESTEP